MSEGSSPEIPKKKTKKKHKEKEPKDKEVKEKNVKVDKETEDEEIKESKKDKSDETPGKEKVTKSKASKEGDKDDDKYQPSSRKTKKIVVKVGMVGDSEVGKTSLMVRYVEGKFDEDYIVTLGVNFLEKAVTLKNNEITFSIWDLGGQRQFRSMLPRVCNDAVAILFMFDLTRKSTLVNIKEWFCEVKEHASKTCIPLLIGTKYDLFAKFSKEEQEDITNQARKFAKAMKAPLIFTSVNQSVNVQKVFKIVLTKAFPRHLKCTIPQNSKIGEPILEF